MRKEDFNNALNYIDYDLIEEYVSEKENAQRKIARQRQIMRYAPLAACLVVILSISVFILPNFFDNYKITNDIWGQNPETQIEPPTSNLPSNNKPDTQTPEKPDASVLNVFTFENDGCKYIKILSGNLGDGVVDEELDDVSEEAKGEYIGTVIVTDNSNNTQFECPIYEYAGVFTSSMNDKGLVVELFEGYYVYFSTITDSGDE